ncbi:unnamed protein product [Onchocerca flexuosa]|uniref:Protein kinase domain-containing protein n=1 Tax=Onchocerca flexuosa TaxID=387005 RepID=A0A183HQ48_9BILA|nr:unnamed protein product [Onchocerca flexuosa]
MVIGKGISSERYAYHCTIDNLSSVMYRGLVNDGYKHPEYLATQDIVICSFETLRKEVYFVEARPRLDSLRHGKRHHIAPTPLLAMEWWRVSYANIFCSSL